MVSFTSVKIGILLRIRLALPEDAKEIAEIYAGFVKDSAISFEMQPPSEEEIGQRIAAIMARHVWLVCLDDDKVIGYSYSGPYRSREAYQWTVETSTYIRPSHKGKGIGKALLTAVHEISKLQGYATSLAGMTLPNDASEHFHKACGYEVFAVYEKIGFKLGEWHSTQWMRLDLNEKTSAPSLPVPIDQLDLKKVVEILGSVHEGLNSD